MPLLSATGRKSVALAPALPINCHPLSKWVQFRRGQFSIVAGAPGSGKSLVATNIAIQSRVPTLFFSADSDEYTVRTRALAILTGQKLDIIEEQIKQPGGADYYAQKLSAVDAADFCFRSDIDLDFIVHRLNAYSELRGEPPHLVIVDNLTNSVIDTDNEYSELRSICRELQLIARDTNAHVMALHHVKGIHEQAEKRSVSIGLGSLQYNLGKIPEIVLGINRPTDSTVNMSVPKNRSGKSDIDFLIDLDYTTATLSGFTR